MNPRYNQETGKLSICYRKWSSMLQRCTNPKHLAYAFYGGRGVTVCARWRSFDAFYQDMGDPPNGHWIDRIDNTKGYQPGNCRWVTPSESAANRKQRGPVPGSLKDRCRQAGMPYMLVYHRMRWGWSEDVAMSTPKGKLKRERR